MVVLLFLLTVVVTVILLLTMVQRKFRQKGRRNTIPAQNEVNGKQLFAAPSAVADYDYPSIADLYSSTIKHVSIVDRGSIQLHDNMAYGETMLLTRPVPQN